MLGRLATSWAMALLFAPVFAPGCAVRPEMCDAPTSCGAKSVCVAYRCQNEGALPALSKSRRFVLDPIDVAFIERRSDAPAGTLPAVFTLGRRDSASAALLLRWASPVLDDADVIEAYVLIDRVGDLDDERPPVGLHAERIASPWDARSATWRDGPSLEDVHAPGLFVRFAAPPRLRIDVAAVVRQWQASGAAHQGLAIVADHWNGHGASFASVPASSSPLPGDPEGHPLTAPLGPRLELYVR